MLQEIEVLETDQPALLEHVKNHCVSLYGSKAQVDSWGRIFIPRWQNERVIINPIIEEGGHVDTAIRYSRHVLANISGKEKDQAGLIVSRSQELEQIFSSHKLSQIPEEVRQAFQTETDWLLKTAGLNPETVRLEEKQKMINWLSKSSLGEDSLGRPNSLITMESLFAARNIAWQRQEQLKKSAVPKYAHILDALIFAKGFDGEILIKAGEELGRLAGVVYITHPGKRDWGVGPTIGMVASLAWLLDQTKVRPYRPAALMARSLLRQISASWQGEREVFDYQQTVLQAKQALGQAF